MKAACATFMCCLVWTCATDASEATPSSDYPRGQNEVQSSDTVSEALFGPSNGWDTAFKDWDTWKTSHDIPLTIGAFHWFHVNNNGPNASGYGIPGIRGTYFYYVQFDPAQSTGDGAISNVGLHADFRVRDDPEKLRPFYDNTYWFYELYGWIDTEIGRFKVGQIWKRFGLDWDGTWWGSVQYFDGFKLNPDYGLSWERQTPLSEHLRLDSFVQYFVAQDGINGSLPGADPESVRGARARNMGVVRVVPTWTLSESSSLAVGLSGFARQIHRITPNGGDDTQRAVAADATYTYHQFSVFTELLRSYGVVNPTRYVSGGPSDRISDVLTGVSYRSGPVTFRFNWSAGFDEHPSGHQYLWVPGMTVALTKNLDLYAEYVHWDVTISTGQRFTIEDGGQFILNWHI
jgi:hypothetical protein